MYHAIKRWFARTLFASWKVVDEITKKSLIEKVYHVITYGLIMGYILWFWFNVYTLKSQSMWLKEKGAVAIEKLNACLSVRETEKGCSVLWQTMCIVYCIVIHAFTSTHWKCRPLWWISKFPKILIFQNWLFKIHLTFTENIKTQYASYSLNSSTS